MSKKCTKCGVEKSVDCFALQQRGKYGRSSWCKPCRSDYGKKYREDNCAKLKQHYVDNAVAIRDRARRRYADKREENLARQSEYRKRPGVAEKMRAYSATWRQENPEKMRFHNARRRAMERSATIIPFTVDQLDQRWAYYGGRCYICGEDATQTDHVKPLSKGGAHALCNLRPICELDNLKKKNKWPYFANADRGEV